MEGDQKTLIAVVGTAAVFLIALVICITISNRDEIAGKRERLELILRSGDCKTLAAELAK